MGQAQEGKVLAGINVAVPLAGIFIIILYELCIDACPSLRGTFLGLDLKIMGVIYMAALLALAWPLPTPAAALSLHARTALLGSGLGGEVVLLHFQIVNATFCDYCLAFGLCILVMSIANYRRMHLPLAFASFLAGLLAFILFFEGSILPLYG